MTSVADRVRAISSWRTTLVLALAVLGFLIAAQLQSQAPRVRYSSQERDPLVATALELQAQQERLKGAIFDERERIGQLEASSKGSGELVRDLNARLGEARIVAGLVPLVGPGIVIRLEDGLDAGSAAGGDADRVAGSRDVRTVVEELWLAGAEAIDVNGERVVATTAFLDIGGSVLANSAYLTPPYDIAAIGPPDLYARVSASPGFIDFVAARGGIQGIRIRFAELTDVPISAYAGTVAVRFGRPIPSATPVAP